MITTIILCILSFLLGCATAKNRYYEEFVEAKKELADLKNNKYL